MRCPSCKTVLPEGFQTCPGCGTFVSSLYQDRESAPPPKITPRSASGESSLNPESITESLKTNAPIIGGLALILMSAFTIITCIVMYPQGSEDMEEFLYMDSFSYVTTIFQASIVLSIVSLIGGIAAIYRRYFAIVNIGCVTAVIFGFLMYYLFGLFAALLVWGVLASSEGEFRRTPPEDMIVLPDEIT